MRMSCNGCRVLRKGCSDNCSIRPCLQWIKSPESQANATVFLAKFYGRAGLMNLINAGPEHLRPAIFRSLLYEACGRIVNPIYGSVGLLWSGSWQLCQAAVEAVLKGAPIVQIPSEAAATPPLKGYDIRHVCKDSTATVGELRKVTKPRNRFKRSAVVKPKPKPLPGWLQCNSEPSHDSSDSIFSTDTMEASHVSQAEPNCSKSQAWFEEGDEEVGLELTLGLFEPSPLPPTPASAPAPAPTPLD